MGRLLYSDDGSEDGHIGQEDDFFWFGNSETDERGWDTEVDMYLSDSFKDLGRLKNFPLAMKLFLKFNTTLPSSAPVKRIFFSLGSQIYVPRRNHLTDENFERHAVTPQSKQMA
jgi:hypothetical protein